MTAIATRRAMVLCCALTLAAGPLLGGCGGAGGRDVPGQQQGVREVLEEGTRAADAADAEANAGGSAADAPAAGAEAEPVAEPEATSAFVGDAECAYADDQIDVDLTSMSADMVYATVADMVAHPQNYLGQVVRMRGPYYHTHYDETNMDYYYVIIADATACCSQGLEFVWGDGSHTWPDEYPQDGTDVTATGMFQTYMEGETTYLHLVDASLQ